MSEREEPAFEKQVVRLPDGRQLIYFRFPVAEPARPASPGAPSPATAPEEER